MSRREFTTDELFELLLLGMMWRNESEELTPMQLCSGILATFAGARIITESQRKALLTNLALARKIEGEAERLYDGRNARQAAAKRAKDSEALLLILMAPREMFSHGLLLGRGRQAYRLVITKKGIEHAVTLVKGYEHLITREKFFTARQKYVDRSRATHAILADREK